MCGDGESGNWSSRWKFKNPLGGAICILISNELILNIGIYIPAAGLAVVRGATDGPPHFVIMLNLYAAVLQAYVIVGTQIEYYSFIKTHSEGLFFAFKMVLTDDQNYGNLAFNRVIKSLA